MKGDFQMYFDGHNDLLWRLAAAGGSVDEFLVGSCPGHLDLRRIQSAGLIGGLFAISIAPWIGSTSRCQREILPNGGYAWPYSPRLTLAVAQDAVVDQRETFRTLISRGEERIFAIRKKGDLSRLQPHALGVVLHLEGADPISDDLSNLDEWHELGLRSLGITWSRPNAFGHGVPIRFPSSADIGSGLTPAGRSLLKSCNERGILVDVSHLNEAGFWDVIRHTRGPVVASHSNYHTLCPSSRNLTDDQARAIKDTGGVIGLNFGCHDLRPDGKEDANTPLELLAQHCLYGLELLGEEFVALGSDFDGTTVPIEIGDVTGLSKLRSVLRSKQVNESTLNKICRDNWLRVLGATLPHA
jgi:membrane dipeptidase